MSEPPPRRARALALATGTAGLLAIGTLMVTITPDGVESPVAVASTTSISAQAAVVPPTAASRAPIGLRGDNGPTTGVSVLDAAIDRAVRATPIGDGRFALATRRSLRGDGEMIIDLVLPSGRQSTGSIVTASRDAVIVALLTVEPGHAVADALPGPDDLVTVLASPPITIPFGDVDALVVGEGTAILNAAGQLVGLCSHDRDGTVRLIAAGAELAAATSVVP